MRYMPNQLPKGKLPTKAYFFNVANTLYEDRIQGMIEHANKMRFKAAEPGISQDDIVDSEDWWK